MAVDDLSFSQKRVIRFRQKSVEKKADIAQLGRAADS